MPAMRRQHFNPIARPYAPTRRRGSLALLPLLAFRADVGRALACNLGSPPPPTIPARLPTSTPQATIGISTLVPLALPAGVEAEAPADPGVEALLRQVDTDQLMLYVNTLQGFETRHVNSSQNSTTRGIGAARQYLSTCYLVQRPVAGPPDRGSIPLPSPGGHGTLQHNVVAICAWPSAV
jgi:hypothetical protein